MATIVGKKVGPIGFGLMGTNPFSQAMPLSALTHHAGLTTSGELSDETCFAAIKAALDAGCNYFNGGEFYGTPERNSLTLLRSYFARYPEDAERAVVNIKGALGPGFVPTGSRADVTASIENVLGTLGPVKRIDQFEVARRDPKSDYQEETLTTVNEYVASGKIGGLACSEIDADTIRSVAKSFKLTAVELELSLFSTEPLTNGILEACGELQIPVLAYCKMSQTRRSGMRQEPNQTSHFSTPGQRLPRRATQVPRRRTPGRLQEDDAAFPRGKLWQESRARVARRGVGQEQGVHSGTGGHQLAAVAVEAARYADNYPDPGVVQAGADPRERHYCGADGAGSR